MQFEGGVNGLRDEEPWMPVRHSIHWLQVASFSTFRYRLAMTAGTWFACSTDNKRPRACQNRWWCVTAPTQYCLLFAWPLTSLHVFFLQSEKKRKRKERKPTLLCFGINLILKSLFSFLPPLFHSFLSLLLKGAMHPYFISTATKLCHPSLVQFKDREAVWTGSCHVQIHCSYSAWNFFFFHNQCHLSELSTQVNF